MRFLTYIPIQEGTAVQAEQRTPAIMVMAAISTTVSRWVRQQAAPSGPSEAGVTRRLHTPLFSHSSF